MDSEKIAKFVIALVVRLAFFALGCWLLIWNLPLCATGEPRWYHWVLLIWSLHMVTYQSTSRQKS